MGNAVALNAASGMMNLILPWESGEVLKVALLRDSVRSSHAVSTTIIWNYIFKVSRPTLSLAAALVAVLLSHTTPLKTLGVVVWRTCWPSCPICCCASRSASAPPKRS